MPESKGLLIAQNRGRVRNIPVTVEAVVVPVPATIAVAIEVKEVPVAERAAENLGELHPEDTAVVVEPAKGLLSVLLVEIPADLGIETDVAGGLDSLHAVFASDDRLAFVEIDIVLELNLLDVDLRQSQGPRVTLGFARETVAHLLAEPGGQASASVGRVAGAADGEKTTNNDDVGVTEEDALEICQARA